MEVYVFDLDYQFHGIVDEYKQLDIERNYTNVSRLSLVVSGTNENINLLQKGRVIAKRDDISHAFIIETRDYVDEKESELMITAFSLSHLLKKRIVLGQQEFTGTVEDVMKSFVETNAVNPTNLKRTIPNLIINNNHGIPVITTEGCSYKPLNDFLFEISNKHDVSWDILFDYNNQRLIFDVWKGLDRSTRQTENQQVIFSPEFENVIKQNYFETDSDLKTTAIVAGEGEGVSRTIITVNDVLSGYDREELYVDARDLQSVYKDQSDAEVTLTPQQYHSLLEERGKSKLAEYQRIQTFESEIDLLSTFKYGIDYFLGDIVSIKNSLFNIILHTRIVTVKESYSPKGKQISVNFGSNIPSLMKKIKRVVK